MWSWISILELDILYLPNMMLKVDLRTIYSVPTEYGAEFWSQRSIFRIYRIWCCIPVSELDIWYTGEYGAELQSLSSLFGVYQNMVWILISDPYIWYLPNMVLNFDLRAQ